GRGPVGRSSGAAAEHVLATVVTDRVEPALGAHGPVQIAVGDYDPLLAVERTGDDLAAGRLDDRRAAAPEHVLALGQLDREVGREGARRDVLRRRYHERAGLDRDV